MSELSSKDEKLADTARLNWWFVNVVLQTDSESGETQSEFEYEAAMCETPDDFRKFIDMQMGVK